jgi:hypothetical protein
MPGNTRLHTESLRFQKEVLAKSFAAELRGFEGALAPYFESIFKAGLAAGYVAALNMVEVQDVEAHRANMTFLRIQAGR